LLKHTILICQILLFLFCSGCTVTVKESETTPHTSEYLRITSLTVAGVGLHLADGVESDQALIQSFEKSSGIRVSVHRFASLSSETEYLDYLSLLDRSSSLPDLLIFPSLPALVQKNILLDLEKYLADDSEYQKIPIPLRKAVSYGMGVPAVPLRYYLEGYFVREDAFLKENISPPTYGGSFARFFSSIQALAKKEKGSPPLRQFYEIPFWYPAIQQKDATVWGGYDGNRFFLSHPHFKNGVSYAAQLRESCFPDVKAAVSWTETPASLRKSWRSKTLSVYYGSTRELAELAEGGASFSFSGIPGGPALIDADYIGITESCADKEEAFRLLKWLSYDKEGIRMRYQTDDDFSQGSLPLNSDSKLVKRFLDANPYDGVKEAVDQIETAIVKGEDYIPTYTTYMDILTYSIPEITDREQTVREWIIAAVDGEYSYYQYADQLNELVNWKEETT